MTAGLISNHLIIPRLIITLLKGAHCVKMVMDAVGVEEEAVVAKTEEVVPDITITEFTERVVKRVLRIHRNKLIYTFEKLIFERRILVLLWMNSWTCFSSLKNCSIFNRFEVNKTPFEKKEAICRVRCNGGIWISKSSRTLPFGRVLWIFEIWRRRVITEISKVIGTLVAS